MKLEQVLKSMAVAAALMCVSPVTATQMIADQDFNFTAGPLVGQGDWLERGTSGSPAINVTGTSLTYSGTGLPASTGGSIFLDTSLPSSGQDVRIPFTTVVNRAEGNTYYWSALVSWDGTQVGDSGSIRSTYLGGFLASNGATSTAFRAVLRVSGDFDGGTVVLGTQYSSLTANYTIGSVSTPLVPNQPVFVVIKMTEVPGAYNDTSEIFYFDSVAVPETEPVTADAISNATGTGVTNDINEGSNDLQQLSLRQFVVTSGNNYPGDFTIDEVRVGTTWEEVAPVVSGVGEWSILD